MKIQYFDWRWINNSGAQDVSKGTTSLRMNCVGPFCRLMITIHYEPKMMNFHMNLE